MPSVENSRPSLQVRLLAWVRGQSLLRSAYRALPRAWREGALQLLTRRIRARTRFPRTAAWHGWQPRPTSPTSRVPADTALPGVNILGYIHGQFGLAEAARSYARALIDNRVPVALRDIDLDLPHGWDDRALDAYIDNDVPHPVSIIFVNPDYLERALQDIGRARLQGRYLIACWFWELETIPDSWLPALSHVDEILVASAFVEQAVRKVTDKPVLRIPMPLGTIEDSGLQRADFGLPETAFIFLVTFDFSSRMERKNPEAAIRAFRAAFPPERRDVRLLVKSSNGYRFPHWIKRIFELAEGDDRIIIRDDVIDRAHLNALQRCCDAYVSLHRAEGFGMGLAECMAIGKPVIATGWSGNMEFMDAASAALVDFSLVAVGEGEYPGGEGQRWADADVAQAAALMRRLADGPAAAAALGSAGRQHVEAILSAPVAAARIIERLKELRTTSVHGTARQQDNEVRGLQ
ncbi:glycosyltransferase [Stenotrophomonas indicatrix]|uniref:glycosyltransferase n=1 Tax=Stenotrophomonas indicatrix TaxID=2045451 RepID=UPI003CE4EADF